MVSLRLPLTCCMPQQAPDLNVILVLASLRSPVNHQQKPCGGRTDYAFFLSKHIANSQNWL
ncbi:hypothetical protein N9C22_03070 [Paracoccaceae bacterium]|nr:hypothetical protein [Paracoccaceae bacterium]HBY13858.1 hypothetical protein [Paracoccaceae bacterium]HCC97296.1 hypothetical protein [Paracoccaceae bacterium]